MKTLSYSIILCLFLFSCKKQSTGPLGGVIDTHPIVFEVLDKNGNNIIHSVNDTLMVTYVSKNGVTVSNRLDIYKIQASETDTTMSKIYNGFVVSDADPSPTVGIPGYITVASGGNIGSFGKTPAGVVNFNFSLNGKSIGAVYFDYWRAFTTSPYFTLNGTPATVGNIPGFLVAGYPAVLKYNIIPNTPSGEFVFVLQYNGVITGGGH